MADFKLYHHTITGIDAEYPVDLAAEFPGVLVEVVPGAPDFQEAEVLTDSGTLESVSPPTETVTL